MKSIRLDSPGAPDAAAVGGDFVGRADELDRLEHALRAAIDGQQGQIALVSGEAGIGKTRLLDELALRARHLGATVLWGACDEAQTGGAYELFRQALDAFVRDAAESDLQAAVGAQAAVLARLVPRLRERFPDLPQPVSLQPDEERTRLFDALSQALFGIARQAPLVLVLDDLHWADADTVALLRHVVRAVPQQPRLLLVAAYRSAEVAEEAPLAETLALVQRLPRVEPLRLQGLASEAVAELLCALPATPEQPVGLSAIDPALVEAVRAQTGGNPFFVRALARQLVEEGVLVCADGRWQLTRALDDLALPESVRQVLRRQLRRLTPEAQRLLTVGAGIGQAFRFDVAAAVAELDEERALAVVDEALAARLIQAGGAPDTYAFVHALVRQTFYEQLNPSRQVRLHRRIAEGMECVYGERAIEYDEDIARHYHRSRSLAGAERGAEHALRAAGRAEGRHAYNQAATLLGMALETLGSTDPRRPRLMARRSLAFAWASAFEESRHLALVAADAIADTEGHAAAAQYLAEAVVAMSHVGALAQGFDLARKGLQLSGPTRDGTWAVLMAADIVRREGEDPSYPGIPLDTSERREVGRVFAHSIAGDAWTRHLLDRTAGSLGSRFWSEDDATSRADLLRRGASAAVFALGQLREGLPIWRATAETAEHEGRIGRAVEAWSCASRFHTSLGELSQAIEVFRHARALSHRLPVGSLALAHVLAAEDELRMARDADLDDASAAIRPIDGSAPDAPLYRASMDAGAARFCARTGRVDTALRRLARVMPAIDRAPYWADNYVRTCCDAAETVWLTRHTEHVDAIARNVCEKVVGPDFRYPMSDGRLALARLYALSNRYDEACEWFAAARAVLDEQGARPLRAIVDYDEALMYARRGARGDRERSLPLLEAALAQFRAISMSGWIRRAEHLRATGTEWSAAALAAPAAQPDATPVVEPAREAIAAAPGPVRSLFHLEGDFWTITYGAKTFRLKHARGLTFLAALLREPGREIAATDLAARTGGNGAGAAAHADGAGARRSLGDAGEVLDAQARASYRARLGELREELDDAEDCHDVGRAERLREEIDMLTTELARAVGLGGRERRAGSHAERARVNVTRAIALSLAKIDVAHPALAEHLRRTVRTGTLCAYRPDPRALIEWDVR